MREVRNKIAVSADLACSALAVMVTAVGSCAMAQDIYWSNASGGAFEQPSNWAPSAVPDASSWVHFDLQAPGYVLDLLQDRTLHRLRVHDDRVTLNLNGHRLGVTETREEFFSIVVGSRADTAGVLHVTEGTLNTERTVIGRAVGATGTVTVGAGVTWGNTHNIVVGRNGVATLNIIDGATVTSHSGSVAEEWGSVGHVLVQGPESQWAPLHEFSYGGYLFIGRRGHGSMAVRDGATVRALTGLAIAEHPGSVGEVLVTGAGSSLAPGAYPTWISIGAGGHGTLSITDGAMASGDAAYIGGSVGSVGIVNVIGPGAVFDTSEGPTIQSIDIGGRGGAGSLNIRQGGIARSKELLVGGHSDLEGTGSVLVHGVGSLLDHHESLTVLHGGGVAIESGGTISGYGGVIAGLDELPASVRVNGAGSAWQLDRLRWENGLNLSLNMRGRARLDVEQGGRVDGGMWNMLMGHAAGDDIHVTVSGSGSRLSSGAILAGLAGKADILIDQGGLLESDFAQVGAVGADAALRVSGSGSVWDNTYGIAVDGRLNVEHGGRVYTHDAYVGVNAGADARLSVSGAGSRLQAEEVYVGGDFSGPQTAGRLTVMNGGTLASPMINVWQDGLLTVTDASIDAEALGLHGGGQALLDGLPGRRLNLLSLVVDADGGSRLDLGDNTMLVREGDSPTIHELVRRGRAGGSWNGSGITSSVAAANPAMALGVRSRGDGVLVALTWPGDATLTGRVDVEDLAVLASNWNRSNRRWYHGDFNFDGMVNELDLAILARNWQRGASGPFNSDLSSALAMFDAFRDTAIPEPATGLSVAAFAGLLLARRRRQGG